MTTLDRLRKAYRDIVAAISAERARLKRARKGVTKRAVPDPPRRKEPTT